MEAVEVRCKYCNKLLFRGHAIRLQISCPRCRRLQVIGEEKTGKSRATEAADAD